MNRPNSVRHLPTPTRLRQNLFALALAGGGILLPSFAGADCTLSGAGTAASPYLIGTYSDLKQLSATFGCDLSKTYQLTADIDASASKGENGAWGFAPIGDSAGGKFTGVFHGAGHAISHLNIVDSTKAGQVTGTNVGLFDQVNGTNARVDHLELVDVHIEGKSQGQNVGAIAGYFSYGSIDSCTVSGGHIGLTLINATFNHSGNVGGVVGLNGGNGIKSCQASDSVIGPDYASVGGIAGNSSAAIHQCSTSGFVFGGNSAYVGGIAGYIGNGYIDFSTVLGTIIGGNSAYAGGIIGYMYNINSKISQSYANIQITAGTKSNVGGLVGYGYGSLNNCYALGSVAAKDSSFIGGIAGNWETSIPIRTSYSLVNIGGTSASSRGQIAGYAPNAEAIHWYSYWNTHNDGPNTSVGKLKVAIDTVTGFGLTDSMMMVQSSFYAFSFAPDSAWMMAPNSYPLLRGMDNASFPSVTGIGENLHQASLGASFHWVGWVAKLDLDKAAQVRVVDPAGHTVLAQTSFAAGSHDLALPRSRSMLFAQVRMGNTAKTLPLSPLN